MSPVPAVTGHVFLRIVGVPLLRRLLPSYAALLLAAAIADPALDWHAVRAQVMGMAPALRTLLTVALVAAWCEVAGAACCKALGLRESLLLGEASAGQRRKAELVCALAGDPDVLLLDETFTHLDREGAEVLTAWLRQWATERVVVLTHHGEVPVAVDQVVELSR